jgi:REP element-mobilizing transposase RayT
MNFESPFGGADGDTRAESTMPSTYTSLQYHIVFGTKYRRPTITADIRDELYRYIAGIIANKDGQALEIGGVEDHIHLLTSCSPRIALADFIRDVKANSSKWLREERGRELFQWQTGYSAFTVSGSQVKIVRRYVRNQVEHHRKQSFEEEYRTLLLRHGIKFDERYLFDEEHHA